MGSPKGLAGVATPSRKTIAAAAAVIVSKHNSIKAASVARLSLLLLPLLLLTNCIHCNPALESGESDEHDEVGTATFETIVYQDPESGLQLSEYAFREPARGVPKHVTDMFCASVKLRLYWNGFRDEINSGIRKGIYLKRMARLARHLFKDVRHADRPFNATMLSPTDDYFMSKLDPEDLAIDKAISDRGHHNIHAKGDEDDADQAEDDSASSSSSRAGKLRSLKEKITKKISDGKTHLIAAKSHGGSSSNAVEEIESSETMRELESEGDPETGPKIKQFLRKWAPKVALAIYTRWRTMWWMMMSCLYTKYYLWDPALDEFNKLKRSLVMWPELQVARMQDLKCPPLMLFKRLMDVCKVLNPLMRFDFGQFNLDKLTRFKSASS